MEMSPQLAPVRPSAIVQERLLKTAIPGPASLAMLERKQSAISSGVGMVMPVFVAAAGGGILVDIDGNSLIDLGSGIAVTTVGNAAPEVVEAITAQAELFTHTCFSVTGYEGYVAVSEALNRITPGTYAKKSALFNSGAEAIENAIKVARYFTGRQGVVAFDHAYHGRTNLTMALTAKSMPYKSGFGPFASDIYRMPMSYPYRDGNLSGPAAAEIAITQMERQIGGSNLAAIIIEPIQGEGGFIVPAPGFLGTLAEWAKDNGVVFIADEVQSGFGRTGKLFACEHEGIIPDLIVTAKGIAGGMPLSALTGRAEIMDAPHAGGLGGTYGGNPLACAAALAALELYENGGLLERAREIGELLIGKLEILQARDARIGDIRGRGAMIAVELVNAETGDPDAALTSRVAAACHADGVVVLTCGTYGNVIRFLPPLAISDELLIDGLSVLAHALELS